MRLSLAQGDLSFRGFFCFCFFVMCYVYATSRLSFLEGSVSLRKTRLSIVVNVCVPTSITAVSRKCKCVYEREEQVQEDIQQLVSSKIHQKSLKYQEIGTAHITLRHGEKSVHLSC